MVLRVNNTLLEDEKPDPTTPATAAATGANPDSAKMFGSSAQKNNAIKKAVTAPTLADTQRLQKAATQQTGEEQQATSLGSRLERVGGLANRVDSMVANKLAAAEEQQAVLGLDEAATANLDEATKAAVAAYITAVNTPGMNVEVAQHDMYTALGNASIDPDQFLQESGIAAGQQYTEAANIPTTMSLSALADGGNIGEVLGYEGGDDALAEDLGVDVSQLGSMNLEQIQQRMRDIEQEDFNRVGAIKAELRSATPDRRVELMAELRDMGATGATGLEASVADLNTQLESAALVEFGGQEYNVSELLENEVISDAILMAVRDPDQLEELRKTDPGLATWIEDNKANLENLSNNVEAQTEEFQTLQTEFQKEVQSASEDLMTNLLGVTADEFGFVSLTEANEYRDTMEASGIWQSIKNDPTTAAAVEALLKTDEGLADLETLKGMEPEEVQAARDAALALEENPVLKDIVGESDSAFILDSTLRTTIESAKGIMDTVKDIPEIASDPDFPEMVKSGILTQDEAEWIASEGKNEWNELKKWHNDKQAIESSETTEDLIDLMFGEELDAGGVNDQMESLKEMADWGNKEAQKKYDMMTQWFGTNGADEGDFDRLRTLLHGSTEGRSMVDIMKENLNGVENARSSIAKPTDGMMSGEVLNYFKSKSHKNADATSDYMSQIRNRLSDGVLTVEEAVSGPFPSSDLDAMVGLGVLSSSDAEEAKRINRGEEQVVRDRYAKIKADADAAAANTATEVQKAEHRREQGEIIVAKKTKTATDSYYELLTRDPNMSVERLINELKFKGENPRYIEDLIKLHKSNLASGNITKSSVFG